MVNDCAYVGETLIKYLPEEFRVLHLKRSRRFFDKTFGIAWKILRSKGDLYHVHYLLQDCYLALKFGKRPLIGHAHGTDLRDTLHSKKWGRIVKYNLKNCDKILVSIPTILEIAKEFNETAQYVPNPYDPEIFYPKPLPPNRPVKHVFIASVHDFRLKGTDKFFHALSHISVPLKIKCIRSGVNLKDAEKLVRKLKLNVEFIDKVPHRQMNKLYWESELVLGSHGMGQLDMVAIEAMACGRPVIHYIRKKYYPNCPLEEFSSIEEVKEAIEKILLDRKEAEKRVKKQLKYIEERHHPHKIARLLGEIYHSLIN
ncbi:MAG: glycosyltransferase family 4 protein [Candidatus Baldrarchaeia archaeon]